MKKLAFLIAALMILVTATGAGAAHMSALSGAKNSPAISPVIDYSIFMNVKLEKYTDILKDYFKTVKKNFDKYNDMIEMMNKSPMQFEMA